MVTHTEEMAFQCEICGKLFNLAGRHGNTYRRRNFQCQLCDKSFARAVNIMTHLVTHTEESAVQCEVYAIPFKYAGSLTKHSKKCENKHFK